MAAHQPATPPAGGLTAAGTVGPGGAGPASPWTAISKLSGLDTVAVAGLLRVSQEQLQDVRGSLIRQVDNITRALPAGWHVAAWFIDIESGRLEFDERGHGTGHLNIVLPVERDGGLPELLEEAKQRTCRFSAVVAENAERLARYTYYGTKVEHELGKHGIELFAADEGIQLDGKKAAKVLMRRMKQAIGEFHAINVMEQAWEGTKVHTQEGYNIGRVPYGYTAIKEPHPAPARRSRGLTRTRLAVDPVRGPVITQIFHWRVIDRYTYRQIAKQLNADPNLYPPPDPRYHGKPVGVGQWTITNVRVMLQNPKYTGHMVWNRTTSRVGVTVRRKKTHRPNPVEQWVWSQQPTHPPLITLNMYRQAQKMSSDHQGSRTTGSANSHPATQHTYLYRGLLRCGYCGWRMHGTHANGLIYYKCRGPRNSAGKPRNPEHPATLCIREDALTPAIANLIATRIFGPERQTHLHHQHVDLPRERAEQHARAIDTARRTVENLTNRQHNLMTELEQTPAEDHPYRAGIRARYRELDQQRTQAEANLAELVATQPVIDEGTPELLAAMPYASANLAAVPAAIQRRLFDALKLTVRIDSPRRAHVHITLTTDTPHTAAEVVADIEPDAAHNPDTTPPPPSGGTMPNDHEITATKHGNALPSRIPP
ncbi:recombinase family protein [Phytohabitans sp. ZYX-F-186]|uniref:Recombinase family protein n=1 Tax=Phytohabitans maris TaxID=3071409 RepID=A0ABU0ZVU8_9ACTN|nr:recombinase family protein [Phytohabitans sp. ZYX-F-186]MDQ7911159.1 recombinase family protein [Phytohabitans sp. ZYX-F-186]